MISNYNKFEIRRTVYDLKKKHARVVKWLRLITESVNLETGKMNNNYTDCVIRKAIILPVKIIRTMALTGGTFQYGSYTDVGSRLLIIDQRDLPKTWSMSFDADDRIIINEQRYTIKDCDNFEDSTIWLVGVVNVRGTEVNNVTSKTVTNAIGINHDTVNA